MDKKRTKCVLRKVFPLKKKRWFLSSLFQKTNAQWRLFWPPSLFPNPFSKFQSFKSSFPLFSSSSFSKNSFLINGKQFFFRSGRKRPSFRTSSSNSSFPSSSWKRGKDDRDRLPSLPNIRKLHSKNITKKIIPKNSRSLFFSLLRSGKKIHLFSSCSNCFLMKKQISMIHSSSRLPIESLIPFLDSNSTKFCFFERFPRTRRTRGSFLKSCGIGVNKSSGRHSDSFLIQSSNLPTISSSSSKSSLISKRHPCISCRSFRAKKKRTLSSFLKKSRIFVLCFSSSSKRSSQKSLSLSSSSKGRRRRSLFEKGRKFF